MQYCKTVTLRTRPIKNGMLSYYLDFYPGYRDKVTMKTTRHSSKNGNHSYECQRGFPFLLHMLSICKLIPTIRTCIKESRVATRPFPIHSCCVFVWFAHVTTPRTLF